jgi:hypothetical protein
LTEATSWGVKSSPQIRSFGLDRAVPGKPFYVTDESQLRTWVGDVNPDGSLRNFRLFAEQGGEGVTADSQGNVYIAAGQIQESRSMILQANPLTSLKFPSGHL